MIKVKGTKAKPYGVYLGVDERAAMEKIIKETGENQHALLQFAVKYFIQQYKAGKIKAEKTTTVKLML